MRNEIHLGGFNEEKLDILLKESSGIAGPGERIAFLSGQFLNTKYQEATLTGGADVSEAFVINLEKVDCFTFIEYIEAMRRSASFHEFRENLRMVRYRSGIIDYENRNHFFTDWKAYSSDYIVDVTKETGGGKSKDVSKRLNEKHDGTLFLPRIACSLREVTYLQSVYMDDQVMERLHTGDYIGIYSKEDGLDVSHTGIIIREQGSVKLRHASSLKKNRIVIDEDLKEYLKTKPGIIVFRPRD
jgi:hypothetical protein